MSVLMKRMFSELKDAHKMNEEDMGVYLVQPNEDNALSLKALVIGPKDSVYEGGFFLFDITIGERFPIEPPKYAFVSPTYSGNVRIHPNLYACGKVCLSILNTWGSHDWSPVSKNTSILRTIQSLLDQDPISHEPGKFAPDAHVKYTTAVRYRNIVMAHDIYMRRSELHDLFRIKIEQSYIRSKPIWIAMLKTMHNQTITYMHGTVHINTIDMIRKLEMAV
jgi:ubiquitin-protein ligase